MIPQTSAIAGGSPGASPALPAGPTPGSAIPALTSSRRGEGGARTRTALAGGALAGTTPGVGTVPATGDQLGEMGATPAPELVTTKVIGPDHRPLVITVLGKPAPQGSKRHVGNGRMIEQSKRVKPWREAVKEATTAAIEQHAHQRLEGPVTIEIAFCFDPPKSAPKRRKIWPTTRSSGDVDKLQRSTFDALTDAGAFRDDSQIVHVEADKWHTDDPDCPLSIPGAVIALKEVSA